MDLERNTELAKKILGIIDPEQKYKGLANLIDRVGNDLPDVITKQHRELLMSNKTLRFADYWRDVYLYSSGVGFRDNVILLTKHRDEVEEWEREDEATIAMRKEKLQQYAQVVSIQSQPKEIIKYIGRNARTEVVREPHPDRIYCQHGSYRRYDQCKSGYYYKLGRMIQTNNADNGDLKLTMQLACLFVALTHEREIMEDELTCLGIDIPDTKRQMQYYNITDLRESASGYKMLSGYDTEFVQKFPEHYKIAEPIERLHNAIDELSFSYNGRLIIKTDEIHNVLEVINPNQSLIESSLRSVIDVVADLRDHVGGNMGAFLRVDPDASNVFCFLNAIVPILETELQRIIERKKYEPTEDDEKAVKDKLIPFIEGKYGGMTFDVFMRKFGVNDIISEVGFMRRLAHMIDHCPDDKTRGLLYDYREHHKFESYVNAVAPITKQHTPTQSDTTPKHEPQPSPTSGNADDVTTPDTSNFSHMESFNPTIPLDMSGLYAFMIGESVIKDIDEQLFADCIYKANMNTLWDICGKLRKRNQMRCVIRYLKDKFEPDWLSRIKTNGLPENIISFNRDTLGEFENKVTNLLL